MKIVSRFKTVDGSEFDSEDQAIKHEALVYAVRHAIKPLGKPLPFSKSSDGWIQHDPRTVLSVKIALLDLMKPLMKGLPDILKAIKEAPETVHPHSVVGRILDDSNSPINEGWGRIGCIDSKGREHNQPYFAINGPDPKHVCVEDRS